MSKTKKKPSSSKAKKPASKASKPAPKSAKSKVLAKPKAAAKPAPKQVAKPLPAEAKKKLGMKDKKKAKKKDELEENLIPEMDEDGGEEIPDLSEFEEEGVAADEVEETEEIIAAPAPVVSSDSDSEIILTDAEGRRLCRVRDCDQAASVEGYCRYHYLLLWKKIQVRRKILVDGKLERYVEELTSRYPDKFLEMIKKDLRTEKDFVSAIAELEIDESNMENEFEDEAQSYIDEVRGVSGETGITEEEEF